MKEVVFVRKNMDKWQKVQAAAAALGNFHPEQIADMYLDISADLAFAQTHYPDSDIIPYLNSLALKLHNKIYGNKQHRASQILRFWTHDIPTEIYKHRNMMLISLIIFLLFTFVGVISTVGEETFATNILGQGYVDMTLKNIERGAPMDVYGNSPSDDMFVGITLNNILVSFRVYVSGLMTCFLAGLILIYNAVMCGTFMAFCYQHGVLTDCLMAMWMHGVIEITSIIIAGGAGLVLGGGWMFPGSMPRMQSFRECAKSSIKIIIGLVPLFIIAGFIESYVTRHQDASVAFRLGIIIGSVILMAFYFIYLPYRRGHNGK